MKQKMIGAAAAYMSGLFFASFCTEGSDLLLLAGLLPVLFIAAKPLKIHTSDIIMLAVFFFAAGAVGVTYNNCVYGKKKRPIAERRAALSVRWTMSGTMTMTRRFIRLMAA
ncbi:MAG: hypothetical protein LUG26_03415 [Ruminococcus sp.]|nr:hypothetical protein [Ruminococcus sp.]